MLRSNTSAVGHALVFPFIRHDGYVTSFPEIKAVLKYIVCSIPTVTIAVNLFCLVVFLETYFSCISPDGIRVWNYDRFTNRVA
jgi:hypothetical protein